MKNIKYCQPRQKHIKKRRGKKVSHIGRGGGEGGSNGKKRETIQRREMEGAPSGVYYR